MTYLKTFTYVIIEPLEILALNLQEIYSLNGVAHFSLERQEQESHVPLGKRPGQMLILRIQDQSGGADTVVRNMLLLTNFVDCFHHTTSYGGLTDTLSQWKLRGDQSNLSLKDFGYAVTYHSESVIVN